MKPSAYFNSLFFKLDSLNSKDELQQLIDRYRGTNDRYRRSTSCSTDDFYQNVKNPLTLRENCLVYLHLNIAFKIKRSDSKMMFIDFRKSPELIAKLCLPLTLKLELIELLVNCETHCSLNCLIPKTINRYMVTLDNKKQLYKDLQTMSEWKIENNNKLFSLPMLIENLKEFYLDYQIMTASQFSDYVRNNCLVIIVRICFS